MKTTLTLAVLSLIACGPDVSHGITFIMDSSKLTADKKAGFDYGIAALNAELGCQAVIVAEGECASGQNCIEVAALDVNRAGECEYGATNDTLRIDPKLNPQAMSETIAHEVGHAFNLYFPDNPKDPAHSPDPTEVMFMDLNEAIWSTDASLKAAVKIEAAQIKATGFTCPPSTGATLSN